MAEVFKANSTSIQGYQKLVAIKRILPDLTKNERFVRMFLDEAKVSLHLNHTNIVQVFDLGMADGTYFIVMEFIDGTNLKKIIQGLGERRQRLSVEQATYIGLEVCKGLAHAHQKKDQEGNALSIVHRDISPPNVLMSREGEVKITDFGLAKAKSQAEITDPGVVKGKFGYLSPEAASGEDVDPRTDIFAVGILLWEMLAGRRLFLGDSDYDTLKLVRDAEIPPLKKYGRTIPPALEKI
ncbi:MAG: serine/threonine protein kinase, partial [Myxococcota bacterium]